MYCVYMTFIFIFNRNNDVHGICAILFSVIGLVLGGEYVDI